MQFAQKYIKSYTLGIQSAMEYRINFILSILSAVFPIIMQYYLWTAIFSSSHASTVYGYTYSEMIMYTVLAALVSKLVATGFEWEISDDIKNGGLNKYIIKPIGYFPYRVCCFLGQKTLHMGMMFILISILLALANMLWGVNVELLRVIIFLVTSLLAIVLNFLLFYSISSIAFWAHDAGAMFIITGLLVNIVSGGVFPLDIFGDKLLRIFDFLPFKYTISYPVNVLSGKLEYGSALQGIMIQCIWIFIFTALSNLCWKAGMKKYVAVGG